MMSGEPLALPGRDPEYSLLLPPCRSSSRCDCLSESSLDPRPESLASVRKKEIRDSFIF